MGMKVVDLFSGCGGMSLGFSEAGYEIAAAFEFWDAAIKCYNCNFLKLFQKFTHSFFLWRMSPQQKKAIHTKQQEKN